MIRVVLPAHLRTLAGVPGEVLLEVDGPATPRSVLDALEARYPMLRGTIRDRITRERRALVPGEEAKKRVVLCCEAERSIREGRELALTLG